MKVPVGGLLVLAHMAPEPRAADANSVTHKFEAPRNLRQAGAHTEASPEVAGCKSMYRNVSVKQI